MGLDCAIRVLAGVRAEGWAGPDQMRVCALVFRRYTSYKANTRRNMHAANEKAENDSSLFQATVTSKQQFSSDIVKLRLETKDKNFKYVAGRL